MSRRTPSRGPVFSNKALVVAGLALFIAVDIVLVALALGWGREKPQTAELDSPTQSTAPVEHAEDVAKEVESSSDADTVRIAPRFISVVSDTVAWRSEGGPCHEQGTLELTINAGETWGAAYPSSDVLGRPLWVAGPDYTTVQAAVASGPRCESQGVQTFDSGASWTEADQVIANSVLVDPNDPSVLVWGGEAIEGPCEEMTRAAVTGGVASVVCGDGSLWSVSSADTHWTRPGVEGAVAVSGSEGRWFAAVESAECDGLGLVEFNDVFIEPLACVPVEVDEATALDLSGNTMWLWAGGQVLISTDLGRSLDG